MCFSSQINGDSFKSSLKEEKEKIQSSIFEIPYILGFGKKLYPKQTNKQKTNTAMITSLNLSTDNF